MNDIQEIINHFTDAVVKGLGLSGHVWQGHLVWTGLRHNAPLISRLTRTEGAGELSLGDGQIKERVRKYRSAYAIDGATNGLTFYLADRDANQGEPPEVVHLSPASLTSMEWVAFAVQDGRTCCAASVHQLSPSQMIEFLSEEIEK